MCHQPDFGVWEFMFCSSLEYKRTVSPRAVTFVAMKPINPKYKTRMAASSIGDRSPPMDAVKLGTGKMLISPRWTHAIANVNNRRAIPTKRILIPEDSEVSICSLAPHQFTVTVGGCSTITQRPTLSELR